MIRIGKRLPCVHQPWPCSTVQRCRGSRWLSTGSKKVGKGTGKEEDSSDIIDESEEEFGIDGFEILNEIEEEDVEATLEKVQTEEEDITPELASELVARMVEATTRRMSERTSASLLSCITPHTITCLRASRISTNTIQAAGSDLFKHPIEKKVTAEINIDSLNLSRPARAALEILSGPRLRDNLVHIGCNRFPSLEENRAHIVTQIDRLVAGAKTAVGENLDLRPLHSWDEIRREVNEIASEEVHEAGGIHFVLGETKQ
ncbi:hypothetical protein BWQ96_03865 [Gracilariopsis chorda]|uniref:Small ribosomal subunit protein mS35 mitochondrial conserved domain-containing protein n=1 Tax=Gracilariopsis chorda TaxID=448386 RepID=A0A2V3IW42_9FLOR|nr:hypothetical protein BWQ96_03865 [Gracilariopsis chorda]|eukprot:PXF46366.1 hypothetical protein BWQ96_03865 [Gracilariopsis chorda]